MKILKITESQYKRLVKVKNLNEQVIYSNVEDEWDVTPNLRDYIYFIADQLTYLYDKPLFIEEVRDGIVYIKWDKYSEEEKNKIIEFNNYWVNHTKTTRDKIENDNFNSGVDWDYEDFIALKNKDVDPDPPIPVPDPPIPVPDPPIPVPDPPIPVPDPPIPVPDPPVVDVTDIDYDPNKKYSRGEYINIIKDVSIEQMNLYGVPASITIAQAILESGNGNSRLARIGKNHFGIKCHRGWTGEEIYADDDAPNECFRKYNRVKDSFNDHSKFLKSNSRYNSLFDLDIRDYKGWAEGLKAAGYATNKDYATKLINIIETNKLYEYDTGAIYQPVKSCVTQEMENKHNQHLNDSNVNNFRGWVHDSGNIEKVNLKLGECGFFDGLDITGNLNDYTIIAFDLVGDEWLKDYKEEKDNNVSSDIGQKIVDKAKEKLGEPYVWGDEFCNKGGDCSGLIDWTLKNVSGIDSPYNGRETTNELRKLVSSKNIGRKTGLGKGDILIFKPKNGEFGEKYTYIDKKTKEEKEDVYKVGHTGFVFDVIGDRVDMIHSSTSKGVDIDKNVFGPGYFNRRYYGVIPLVDGKYETK